MVLVLTISFETCNGIEKNRIIDLHRYQNW